MDVWLEGLDNYDITAVIMLDLSTAFTDVDHKALLDKLKICGFEDKETGWMHSYIRQQAEDSKFMLMVLFLIFFIFTLGDISIARLCMNI